MSLNGNIATYYPAPGFVGSDSFTYAAWDGFTDSNLGTVSLTTTPGQCVLTANTLAPTAAFPNSPVPFRASGVLSQCVGDISYDWDFGDGSAHGFGTNVSHTYASAGNYNWTLSATTGGTSYTTNGLVIISPTLGPPVTLSITSLGYMMNLSWPADSVPCSLETTTDWTQSYAWQPDVDPVIPDGTNLTVQVFLLPGQQFFRLRRVP